jgi:hypothetical protein
MVFALAFLVLSGAANLAAQPAVEFERASISAAELTPDPGRKALEFVCKLFVERYAKQHRLQLTGQEKAGMRRMASGLPTRSAWADDFILGMGLHWKVNRALWLKHGGRVVLSSFGFQTANDALEQEFKVLEDSGVLRFRDPAIRTAFYTHLDRMPGNGVVSGEQARAVWARPPWQERATR